VALKILPKEMSVDGERMRRFSREAKAASALNHPNVAHIYEIGEAEGVNFIAMEYVEGQTLAAKINGHPLPVSEVVEIGSQIADALDEAHRKGITHRDIKPANLMLTTRGQVKVLDFGLAKIAWPTEQPVASDISTMAKTASGVVMGTAPYMSPEQALGREVDHRSDVFSLGIVLYEMLTGRRPFAGETVSETIAAILRDEPPPLAQQAPDCPASLARIVNRCLAKAPEERYKTAGELVIELKSVRAAIAEGSQSARKTAEPATLRSAERLPKRRWRRAALASVIALIGLMAAVYYFGGGRETAETPIKTIAVLPLRPLQSGERDEALEMGTASMLITRLSSLRQLIVRPESAVQRYARPDQDSLAAGREQKVDAVLDSRYQRSGDKFRFTLRLLRIADGATLWADTLDQQTADLFAIQDALSAKVTGALKLTLSSADQELLAKRYTNSAEAWQLYVRGRHFFHQRGGGGTEKANDYLERAIALDPSFALAYATLGHQYAALTWVFPDQEFRLKAKAANEQALKLDDQLAEAHSFLACYKQSIEWDHNAAAKHHQRALDLNPNSADVRLEYAYYLAMLGRFEQAIPEIRKAEELDPTDRWISGLVSTLLIYARDYDGAIEQGRRTNDLNPNSDAMIRAYEMKGDEQTAFALRLKQAEASGMAPEEIASMKAAFATGGWKGFLRNRLDLLLEQEKRRYVSPWNIALHHARLGEKEQALARLQQAVDDRSFFATALNVEPAWDSYRTDPRFMALVRRVGLTP
jgi:TolB-like protein/Flp pilus assembly protein TadD